MMDISRKTWKDFNISNNHEYNPNETVQPNINNHDNINRGNNIKVHENKETPERYGQSLPSNIVI